MVNWKLLDDGNAKAVWDKSLLRFPDYTLFQTFMWGEYKRNSGWSPKRWIAIDENDEIIAMVQGLLRIFPLNLGLIWVPGGPAGDLSAICEGFFKFAKKSTGLKRLFCRFYLNRKNNLPDEDTLRKSNMAKARCSINSGLSMLYNLFPDKSHPKATKNWRHNLRRSEKHDLSVRLWERPDIDSMLSVYEQMEGLKKIGRQYSREELIGLFETMSDKITLYRCDNAGGELLGFRGCAIIGNKGWDLLAAVTAEGRRSYASYALFDRLMQYCRDAGILYYDMGGVDPIRNPGVYNFKKGTGAVSQEYLGEWDWAMPRLLRPLVNWAVYGKRGTF
ncbi:MAG: peptidoglycan bridge formation glycyltransferase FemA/FemB family protein [Nitrospirae bacterium]|nr:peptidoglycan bridge formation glycyltransferase FemA/FemB family protein [Nitrospirota bacterium]